MEITILKENLVKGLSRSQSVVERRTSMPILCNVLLKAQNKKIIMTATDLETIFLGEYPAQVKNPGAITVPARKLYEIVKELPGNEIYLKEKGNSFLHLSAGRATYNLVGLSAENYPSEPRCNDLSTLTVSGKILSEMIEKTIFSISQEENRFNLAGLYIEKRKEDDSNFYLRFVSTDGHRLSLIDKKIKGLNELILEKGIIISRKGIIEIRKLAEEGGELVLMLNQKLAVVSKDCVRLILRIQDGSFPNYDAIFPKTTQYMAVVNRRTFSEVLKRISIITTNRFQGVHLNFKDRLLEVVSQNPLLGEARESLEIDFDGKAFGIGFNARYFLDLCSAMSSDKITLSFVDEQSPCLVKGEMDVGFLSIIMPMRL